MQVLAGLVIVVALVAIIRAEWHRHERRNRVLGASLSPRRPPPEDAP